MSPKPFIDWVRRAFCRHQSAYERRVLCGRFTDVPIDVPIDFRYAYLDGAGQLCLDCYYGRILEPARFPERHDLRVRSNGFPDLPSTSYLSGKRVLVTGAGGVIGSEICRQVALQRPEALFLLGHDEDHLVATARRIEAMFPGLRMETVLKSVQDPLGMLRVLSDTRPHAVFHAAAYKIATWMEKHPRQAIVVNGFGTLSALEASLAAGVERFVMVSTATAARAVSVLGATKRLAEYLVQAAGEGKLADLLNRVGPWEQVLGWGFTGSLQEVPERSVAAVSVRLGNVIDSLSALRTVYQAAVELGHPLEVTHPQIRRHEVSPQQAVSSPLTAGGLQGIRGTLVVDMGEPVRLTDLAREVLRSAGAGHGWRRIRFTGLQPGEELSERLLADDERLVRTGHAGFARIKGLRVVGMYLPGAYESWWRSSRRVQAQTASRRLYARRLGPPSAGMRRPVPWPPRDRSREGVEFMAGVIPLDEDAYRVAMARSALRRIKRRQNALRRRWHELSREKVEAELLAIGRELVEAAPLFLPRAFGSGGKAIGSDSGKVPCRNGRYDGAAEWGGADPAGSASHPGRAPCSGGAAPEVTAPAHEGPDELLSTSKRLLDELEQILKKLESEKPDTKGWH